MNNNKSPDKLSNVGGSGANWRRLQARSRTLRALLKETQRALRDVAEITQLDASIANTVQDVSASASRCPALVLLGTSGEAKVRLLHALLGTRVLPDKLPRGCRWIQAQYGSSRQAHLTLGSSEFELVDVLESSRGPWETLPEKDLIRQDATDLATIVEIELDSPLLKDGLRIIIPPDLEQDPGPVHYRTLKQLHKELYAKRERILNNFSPVYLFAIDTIGENIFCDNITAKIPTSKSEEDFWNTFNLYNMAKMEREEVTCEQDSDISEKETWDIGAREKAVISAENCLDLHQMKQLTPRGQVLFVLLRARAEPPPAGADRGLLGQIFRRILDSQPDGDARLHGEQVLFMHDLMDQWELMFPPPSKHYVRSQWIIIDDKEILKSPDVVSLQPLTPGNTDDNRSKVVDKDKISHIKETGGDGAIKSRTLFFNRVTKFMTESLQSCLLENCTKLSEVHVKIVQHLILTSFSLARELQVVPRRIQYVATQEQQIYKHILEKFLSDDKKQELVRLMQEVMEEMELEVQYMDWSVDDLPCHKDQQCIISNSIFYSTRSSQVSERTLADAAALAADGQTSDVEEAESYDGYNFDDYEIINMNEESLSMSEFCPGRTKPQTAPPISVELGSVSADSAASVCTSSTSMSVNEAGLDVQKTVLAQLSRKINLKLEKFVDCLNDTYFGTLERCLASLERACQAELAGPGGVTALCRAVRAAATRVALTPAPRAHWRHVVLHHVYAFMYRLRLRRDASWCCPLSAAWRRRAALAVLRALPASRAAAVAAAQIISQVSAVHAKFQAALAALEAALTTRLLHTEDVKLAIRKKFAPGFARLCLESTSLRDLLAHGAPALGREIGRGQYGVVYAARGGWAGVRRVAVKSVTPADARHRLELAMEFFYARSLPPHPNVVRILGSICRGPGVLLVAPRLQRDLHAAVAAGLAPPLAVRVAVDVLAGLRFLHSLGLVHRDVKMKNVLLDQHDRAALSDLGFMSACGLVCGSVVGTPVHMAPELLDGCYDATVDVYAFGILFWYLCAGSVNLPKNFECLNKEQLWKKVKQGLRPERLPHFRPDCWDVMQGCWHAAPQARPLLGHVQHTLQHVLQEVTRQDPAGAPGAEGEQLYRQQSEFGPNCT